MTIAKFLLASIVVAFSFEMLEMIQTVYEAEEHFDIISLLVEGKLFVSMILVQIWKKRTMLKLLPLP